jgi:hypothetical protein
MKHAQSKPEAPSLPYFDRPIAADRRFIYVHANKGAAL